MTHENSLAAAILGELIPELEYAAPTLLERLERGERLVESRPPTDLGFETGAIAPQLLELFTELAPYVQAVLSYGALGILQTWLLYERGSKSQEELSEKLTTMAAKQAELERSIRQIADALARAEGTPVSAEEVTSAIAAAAERMPTSKDVPRQT